MTLLARPLPWLLALLLVPSLGWSAASTPEAPEAESPPPEAKPEAFSAAVVPDQVKLGEPFTLTIEVRDGKDQRYELPRELSLGPDVDLVRIVPSRERDGNLTVTRFEIVGALFSLEEKKLPDIVLEVSGPGGIRKLTVPGPTVTGAPALAEEDEGYADILPPVEVLVPRYTLLYVLAGAIAAGFLAWGLYRLAKRWPRHIRAAPVVPILPVHLRALQALEALQREDLPGQGRGQEFHFRLSEILRAYLGERFGFLALDMTSEELLATLARLPTPGFDYARFEALCREADLVKFARAPATPTHCKVAIEAAFGFVHATTPTNAPAGTGAGGVA